MMAVEDADIGRLLLTLEGIERQLSRIARALEDGRSDTPYRDPPYWECETCGCSTNVTGIDGTAAPDLCRVCGSAKPDA